MKRSITGHRSRPAACVVLAASALLACSGLWAQSADEAPRITPQACEKWEARSRALARSEEPLERELGELLLQPELEFCVTRQVPVKEAPDQAMESSQAFLDLAALAGVLQWLAIAVLAGLLLWLLVRLKPGRWLEQRRSGAEKTLPQDRTQRLPSAPEDALDRVLERAEQAWQSGDQRGALSLLYRGALARLWPERRDQRTRTEGEVLALLRQRSAPDELLSMMQTLTRLWQQSAWAHRLPEDDEFRAIHRRWARHFGAAGDAAP